MASGIQRCRRAPTAVTLPVDDLSRAVAHGAGLIPGARLVHKRTETEAKQRELLTSF